MSITELEEIIEIFEVIMESIVLILLPVIIVNAIICINEKS